MEEIRRPAVKFQPDVYEGLRRGFSQIVNVVRPTLGPFPRIVAYDHLVGSKPPELLDDGGVIVRRIIQIANRAEDVGAMFLRQVLWRVHERVGDGTATTAVLFEAIYNQSLRFLAAGGNSAELRGHLEAGMRLIDAELARMTVRLTSHNRKEKFAQVARSICHEPDMAKHLGEIFDIIGEYGVLDIRTGRGREFQREYVEGMYWPGALLSRQFVTDPARGRAELENAAILISDLDVSDPRDLIPALNAAIKAEIKTLLLVARSISDLAVHLLQTEKTREKIHVVAAKTPYMSLTAQAAALQDLAVLTGGRPVLGKAGQTLRDAQLEDLGRARRVWADKYNFGVSGGRGDKRQLREHIAKLRLAYRHTDDLKEQDTIQERIGKLLGGSATLWIGAATQSELETQKELAKRTARAMRGAVLDGLLPGGGAALLACRPALQARLDQSYTTAERAAYRILLEASEAPIRALLTNAGHEPSAILGDIYRAGPGYGFDLQTGQVVDMSEAGIFDVAAVQRDAIRSAISSAALALTIEAVVHHKKPRQEVEP